MTICKKFGLTGGRSFVAASALGLLGSVAQANDFSPVDERTLAAMPAEPVSAMVGKGDYRVGMNFDSPSACIAFSKNVQATKKLTMPRMTNGNVYESDVYVSCFSQRTGQLLVMTAQDMSGELKVLRPTLAPVSRP